MGQRVDETADLSGGDDERLGEAIERYLALIEGGEAPAPEVYAARFPDLEDDVRAALEGLELVNGLVGQGVGASSSLGCGPGRNIESGRRIAGYRVVRELGRGGMGTVYEAVHVGLDRPVALKVLGVHAAPDSSARRRFLNEARTAAGLHHTHIVPVFDVGQVGGLCYYAMQRIEGSGLDRVIRRRRRRREAVGLSLDSAEAPPGWRDSSSGSNAEASSRLNRIWVRVSSGLVWGRTRPETDAAREIGRRETTGDSTMTWNRGGAATTLRPSATTLRPSLALPMARDDEEDAPSFEPPHGSAYHRWAAEVGLQAAEALAHAHHHGVIHRDVKPSNLLIDAQGTIWVADFGLARRLADPGMTHHDSLLGTPRYMSPEQGRIGVIDGRTDVYSLGATLYELLTLRPPFDGSSAAELLDQIAGRDPVPPRAIDRRIPRDLETIVLKSLAKRPADRYESAAALGEDLARFLNHEPVRARRISPVGRMWRVACRHPGITSVSAVASVLVVSIAAYAYNQVRNERDQARDARNTAVAAREKTESAERETRSAMRTMLWRHAALVRSTSEPDRRTRGLELLKQSAELEPGPELKAQLREEASEFLVLRDVRRTLDLPTLPITDLVFDAENARLAVLSQDGEELALWDVNQQRKPDKIALSHGTKLILDGPEAEPAASGDHRPDGASASATAKEEVGPPASAGGGKRSGGPARGQWGRWRVNQLAPAGVNLAVIPPESHSVMLVNGASGATVRELARPDRRVVGVFGEPTGKRLASVDVEDLSDGRGFRPGPPSIEYQIVLWDLERPEAPPTVLDHVRIPDRPMVFGPPSPLVALSPDGKTAASALFGATTVRVFSAEDGRPLKAIESQAQVTALAAGPGGRLATASDGTIQIWNVGTGEFLSSYSSSQGFVAQMQFDPRGRLLATAGGFGSQEVELWDLVARKPAAVLPSADRVMDLGFSADGKTLVVGGRGNSTWFWTIAEPPARTQVSGFEHSIASLAIRDDGLLAIGDDAGETWLWCGVQPSCPQSPLPHNVSMRSRRKGEGERESDAAASKARFRDRAAALAFDARGDLVAHDARGLKVWPAGPRSACEPIRLDLPRPINEFRFWIPPMARSGDGRTLALAHGRSVYLLDSGRLDRVVPVVRADEPPLDPVNPLYFPTPNRGPRTSDSPKSEPPPPPSDAGRVERPVDPPQPRFQALQLTSAGGRIFLLDERRQLQVLALRPATAERIEAEPVTVGDAMPKDVLSMALRPDGRLLALGDFSGIVTLVDAERLTIIGRLDPVPGEPADSVGPIGALAFSPDGRRLVAGAPSGSIHLWSSDASLNQYEYRYRLPGQCGRIASLAFDAMGKRLAAGGHEPLVEVWDLDVFESELKRLGLAD